MPMKNILITGGAGFIGSHLSQKLVDEGNKVTVLDNLITGREENISGLLQKEGFTFVKGDVVDPKNRAFELDFDMIFHLASPASPKGYYENPEETLLANSLGTLNVLNLAKNNKSRILIASTSEIYGDPKVSPQKEEYWGNVNSFGPRACYDESKRFAEAAAYVFINKYSLDARIVRIFNTYGPRMQKDDGRVISNFINQALNDKDITIYGDGGQTRSFCYIDDMVSGICKVMFTDDLGGQIFNLGNPEEYTMFDLAQKIKDLTASKSEFVYKDLPKDDPKQRCPDISKVKEALEWEPVTNLGSGIAKTVEYYKSLDQ